MSSIHLYNYLPIAMNLIATICAVTLCLTVAAAIPHERVPIQPRKIDLNDETSTRIVNGELAQKGQIPWQVLLLIDNTFICGGSLITNKHILTAAHCATAGRSFRVLFGALTLSDYDLSLTSTEPIVHPDYSLDPLVNDIAIIVLPETVTLTATIQYVPISEEEIGIGVNATVSGWGDISDDVATSDLHYVTVGTISNAVCNQYFTGTISTDKICTAPLTQTPQGACLGDSGGPLVTGATRDPKLIGVVCFVAGGNCDQKYPSGFTRVSTFADWINEQIAA